MRQSTGKLDLTWPPPQADEEPRQQVSEVEDFFFESFKSGIICVLHSFTGINVYITGVGNVVAKDLGW